MVRIKDGFELQNRSGQSVVVYNGSSNLRIENSIVLSDTAIFLWNLLKEKDVTKREMLEAVLNNFDISTVLALGNIDVFVRTLKENNIIEE